MQSVVIIVSVLAALGAVACWVIGARAQAQMLNALPVEHQPRFKWPLIAVWPFARGRLQYATADRVQMVNKSLLAFIACVMVALSAASLASNLTRFSR
ncbi:MAG: hypothetical protein AB1490_04645 [Pseudomonadota bacterium]